jgi:hypothetical protein
MGIRTHRKAILEQDNGIDEFYSFKTDEPIPQTDGSVKIGAMLVAKREQNNGMEIVNPELYARMTSVTTEEQQLADRLNPPKR